jgi:AcrR family transcriptional regulator
VSVSHPNLGRSGGALSETLLKHSRLPRKYHPAKNVKSQRGHAGGAPIPVEKRQEILEDAKQEILAGRQMHEIAQKHGLSPRTLQYWLSSLGEEYEEIRRAWLDGMLIEAGELLEGADDPLRLARARELWKRATWYAERRDRQRYGQDQTITVNIVDLGDRLRRARERVIEQSPPMQAIESTTHESSS